MRIPNSWEKLTITPENNSVENNTQSVSYKQILPSLWKVEATQSLKDALVVFNNAYDEQWITQGVASEHYRCNGYANCFKIQEDQTSFYIFYWPEWLNITGWGITLLSVLVFGIILCSRSKRKAAP